MKSKFDELNLEQLTGLTINFCDEEENRFVIDANTNWIEINNKSLVKNGSTAKRKYYDVPVHEKQVNIELVSQRWVDKTTNLTYQSQAPCMHPKHRITYRLYDWLVKQFEMLETDRNIARKTGFERSTINKMMKEWYLSQNGPIYHGDVVIVPWSISKGNTKYGIIHFGRERLLYIADNIEILKKYFNDYSKYIKTIFIPFDLKLHSLLSAVKRTFDIRITLESFKNKIKDSLFDTMIEEIKNLPKLRKNLIDEQILNNISESRALFKAQEYLTQAEKKEIYTLLKSKTFQKYYSLSCNFLTTFENEKDINTYTVDDSGNYTVIQLTTDYRDSVEFTWHDNISYSSLLLNSVYEELYKKHYLLEDATIVQNKEFLKLYGELSLLEDKFINICALPDVTSYYIRTISQYISDDFKKYTNEQIIYKYKDYRAMLEDFSK